MWKSVGVWTLELSGSPAKSRQSDCLVGDCGIIVMVVLVGKLEGERL